MRETLFHGKRIDNGEWIEGYYAGYGLICPNEPESTYNATGDYYGQTPYVGFVEVDPETVGRYTGLKDKNGKRIFEGGIVKAQDGIMGSPFEEEVIGRITYGECAYFIEPENPMESLYLYDECAVYEVIGNIHDNPELLEVR